MRVMHLSDVCGTMESMDAIRDVKISVNLTAELAARLDRYAARNHWPRSTAVAVLIDRCLDDLGDDAQ